MKYLREPNEFKRMCKRAILDYIFRHRECTRKEIADALNLSQPTVIQRLDELGAEGLVIEKKSQKQNRGRRSMLLTLRPEACYSVGVEIGKHSIRLILCDFSGTVQRCMRRQIEYELKEDYARTLGVLVDKIVQEAGVSTDRILGVGVEVPGTVDSATQMIRLCLTLDTSNIPMSFFTKYIAYPCEFIQDHKAGCFAEIIDRSQMKDFVYVGLSQLVGGAIVKRGELSESANSRGGEFGHMCLYPHGRRCYCGNEGCVDAYLASTVLTNGLCEDLASFFAGVEEGRTLYLERWYAYMEALVVLLNNLNMAFDCPIVLGGELGKYLKPWIGEIDRRVTDMNFFRDSANLCFCNSDDQSHIRGAALLSIDSFLRNYGG